MKKLFLLIPTLVLFSVSITACEVHENAENAENAEKTAHDAYAFATSLASKTGAIFLSLKNKSDEEDVLIGAKSDLAEITELHQNLIDPDDGKMMMRRVKEIVIPANETVDLSPTGYHIMLINLKEPLVKDSKHTVTLEYKNKGEVEVDFVVTAPGKKLDKTHNHDDMMEKENVIKDDSSKAEVL